MRTLILILAAAALTFTGSVSKVTAEEPKATPVSTPNVELEEHEVEGNLGDIMATFKLDQMEITGSVDVPRFAYTKPWQDPDPFLDQTEDLVRTLIDKHYNPLDRDSLSHQVGIITGPRQKSSGVASRGSGLSKYTSLLSNP